MLYLTYLDIFNFLSNQLNCVLAFKGNTLYVNTRTSELNAGIIAGTIEGLLYSQEYKKTVEVVNKDLIKIY